MLNIREQRGLIQSFIDPDTAADAPTSYYGLYHDPARSSLFARAGDGFVGRFQTGIDLFRPLVTMRCFRPEPAADLLSEALTVGRPYLFFAHVNQLPLIGGSLQLNQERILGVYVLDPTRYKVSVNVLVTEKSAVDGTPRAEIHSGGLQAACGVNWQSPGFAEVYVHTEPEARRRGWGRSVLGAVTGRILSSGRLPIYLVELNNEASIGLATGVGYVDTGARQVFAEAIYLGHPNHRA
jgi:GNAT superfamily N-acetyltransferase